MQNLKYTFKQVLKYPSAIIGVIIISILVAVSIYTVITIPRDEAVYLWRGGEAVWRHNPKNAFPSWYNYFRSEKLPESFVINSNDPSVTYASEPRAEGSTQGYTFSFEYTADEFPQDVLLYLKADYLERNPFVSIYWYTPDGREIRLIETAISASDSYRASQDLKLTRRLGDVNPQIGLFADPDSEKLTPLKGTYTVTVDVLNFEDESQVTNIELIQHGQVAGFWGTDNYRRDIGLAILWGAPIALSFGLIASFGTSVISMIIAAVGVWFGGWVDELIQRVTEITLALPFLNILIMVGIFYTRSIWTMLWVTVVLSIFSGAIKTNRAIFLQTKESPYIEAAKAYGASGGRIIFSYLIPRIVPLLIPTLVLGVPSFVFLEATLSVLGLGDPVLPTWGKLIERARSEGAVYSGYYYWMLEPAALLVLTGFGFAMLGFALDRVFNPRLRDI